MEFYPRIQVEHDPCGIRFLPRIRNTLWTHRCPVTPLVRVSRTVNTVNIPRGQKRAVGCIFNVDRLLSAMDLAAFD
jgi:hypothetical protein